MLPRCCIMEPIPGSIIWPIMGFIIWLIIANGSHEVGCCLCIMEPIMEPIIWPITENGSPVVDCCLIEVNGSIITIASATLQTHSL